MVRESKGRRRVELRRGELRWMEGGRVNRGKQWNKSATLAKGLVECSTLCKNGWFLIREGCIECKSLIPS